MRFKLDHWSTEEWSPLANLNAGFSTNIQNWQYWHYWQLCISINLQFFLYFLYVSKCENRGLLVYWDYILRLQISLVLFLSNSIAKVANFGIPVLWRICENLYQIYVLDLHERIKTCNVVYYVLVIADFVVRVKICNFLGIRLSN